MLLAKTKSNTIEVLISKAWIDSYINHNEFDSVNKIIREYNEMEEKIKKFKNAVEYYIQNNGNLLFQLQDKYC